jgi:hypothetical protein
MGCKCGFWKILVLILAIGGALHFRKMKGCVSKSGGACPMF